MLCICRVDKIWPGFRRFGSHVMQVSVHVRGSEVVKQRHDCMQVVITVVPHLVSMISP